MALPGRRAAAAGDQSGASVVGGVVPGPLGEDQQAVAELHDVEQVDEEPSAEQAEGESPKSSDDCPAQEPCEAEPDEKKKSFWIQGWASQKNEAEPSQ